MPSRGGSAGREGSADSGAANTPPPASPGRGKHLVHIHYLRPPDRTDVYTQELVHDAVGVKVTLARDLKLDRPLTALGRTILEPGSDAVWFTFPDAWHDIGRFHLADGTFTGVYANILVPCVFEPGGVWHTTDLFLDLWMPAIDPEGTATTYAAAMGVAPPHLLDEDELERAAGAGWIDAETAERAREEARRLLAEWKAGHWPPPVVREWTRERALRR